LLAGVVVSAGCSAHSSSTTSGSPAAATGASGGATGAGPATALTVGMGAGVYTAPMSANAFEDAGLAITQKPVTSGAVAVPLLLNGQLQFSEADAVGALTAISKGVPLEVVGAVTSSGATAATDNTGILVKSDSAIRTVADLDGKKVAVNAIGGSAQLSAKAAVDKLGGDSSTISFVELPPTAIPAAVQNGTVDAAVTTLDASTTRLRVLISPMSVAMPGAPLIVWITSKAYAAENRNTVQRFAHAAQQADSYLTANPGLVRQITADTARTKPDAAAAAKLVLPQFQPTTVQPAALQEVVDLMLKYKVIGSPIDLSKVLFS
jgi:NitT/TauT family transport system substrate-binding protein